MAAPSQRGRKQDGASREEDFAVVIVGAGLSGLCAAIKVLEAGLGPVVIYEKEPEVGGCWWLNTYPGCACDVPAHLYSLSFEHTDCWTRVFPSQPEILSYLRSVASRHRLKERGILRLNTTVLEGRWNDQRQSWEVTIRGGGDGSDGDDAATTRVVTSRYLVMATGTLTMPRMPSGVKGMGLFQGPSIHTACWDHSVSLEDKRVAVVGTGASAVQTITAIAPTVSELTVLQRSPPYILPKPDFELSEFLLSLSRRPWFYRLVRGAIFWIMEALVFPSPDSDMNKPIRRLVRYFWGWSMRRTVADPKLREALTPGYEVGCKRVLFSGEYYSAMVMPKVKLVTSAVVEVTRGGVVDGEGQEHQVDVIVWATSERDGGGGDGSRGEEGGGGGDRGSCVFYTFIILTVIGFDMEEQWHMVKVIGQGGRLWTDLMAYSDDDENNSKGREGRSNSDDDKNSKEEEGRRKVAYLGTMVKGVPNFFRIYGPYSNLGHTSVVLLFEGQCRLMVDVMKKVEASGARSVDVKEEAWREFGDEMGRRLRSTVWFTGGCTSWYLGGAGGGSGRLPDLMWPGTVREHQRRTRHANASHFVFRDAEGREVVVAAGGKGGGGGLMMVAAVAGAVLSVVVGVVYLSKSAGLYVVVVGNA